MTENQTRLFTLNETESAENCPVSISGGYLYKDDTSNSIKACLQISNKSGKELKSLRFRLHPIDKDGKLLAFDEELDRNGPFKANGPIELEDIMLPFITASFKAELVKAETADGSKLDLQGMPAVKEQSEQKSEDNTESSSGEKTPEKSVQEQNSDDAKEVRTGNDDAKPASAEKEEMSSGEVTVNTVQQAKQEVKPSRRSVFKKLIVILIPAILILSGLAIIFIGAYLPERRYLKAVDLFNTGEFIPAINAFEKMNGYKDSATYINTAETMLSYQAAASAFEAGDYETAYTEFNKLKGFGDSTERASASLEQIRAIAYAEADSLLRKGRLLDAAGAFYRMKDYSDSWNRCFDVWGRITDRNTISAGGHTVCLKKDGEILTAGSNDDGELDLTAWENISDISAGNGFTVGLKPDGTVVAAGNNDYGQCDVEEWEDIVSVYAGYWSTVGIKADGTVVLAGRDSDVGWWKNIKSVNSSIFHTVGLLTDGTVVAAETKDISGATHNYGQFDVSGWKDITAVSTGVSFTVGLKKDGTVVAVGDNTYGQCDIEEWEDIVAISANGWHVVGLKSDGTVVAAGWNENGECDVEEWEDIVAISTGTSHTIGLKADGTVVAAGNNKDGRCEVEGWSGVRTR